MTLQSHKPTRWGKNVKKRSSAYRWMGEYKLVQLWKILWRFQKSKIKLLCVHANLLSSQPTSATQDCRLSRSFVHDLCALHRNGLNMAPPGIWKFRIGVLYISQNRYRASFVCLFLLPPVLAVASPVMVTCVLNSAPDDGSPPGFPSRLQRTLSGFPFPSVPTVHRK